MNKFKYLLSFVLLFFISVSITNAASFSISANKKTVVVGNTVNVTVSVTGGDAAGWEYCLNYDANVFTLTSATSDTGDKCVKTGSTLTGYKSVTYTLKAKKSGSSNITLSGAAIYNDDLALISSSYNTVTLTAKTQAEIEASYSTNAYLKSLSVDGYDINPSFNKDTLEYSLEVENEVESININASRADNKASLTGAGTKELTEGLNKFEIVVTAEKGNKKVYVVNVTRKELNPIHVIVDKKDYTIVRKVDVMTAPTYYASTEVEIQGELVPAFKSDITGYVLVGLKDENGIINLYRYDDSKEEYVLYCQLLKEGVTLIPLESTELISGYEIQKEININNNTIIAYTNNNENDFVLVYGMNASNGELGWYKYDTKEETFQRYEVLKNVVEKDELDMFFILTIVFASLSFVSILLVIILLSMNSKLRKKNNKLISMIENSRKKDDTSKKDVVEEKQEEITEDNKQDEVIESNEMISKREQRRLEKQKEQEQQEELRKMQEDFLKTEVNEIVVDDVELEESAPVRKRGRKKK
jgi:hypothetical protein